MTPEEAQAYVRRWRLANAMEIRELRETSVDVKLRQLASMMAAAKHFPDPKRDEEVEIVRKRGLTLKEKYFASQEPPPHLTSDPE